MQHSWRLRHRDDFARLRADGRTAQNPYVVLSYLVNDQANNRYGFVCSRRLGKAVVRNKMRRRLREVIRHYHPWIAYEGQPCDLVLIARGPILKATFHELTTAIGELLRREGLLKDKP